MNNEDVRSVMRSALRSMGYTQISASWFKPVGWHVFSFKEEALRWTNHFRGVDGSFMTYNSEAYSGPPEKADALLFLKMCEAYTRIDVAASHGSTFELDDRFGFLDD